MTTSRHISFRVIKYLDEFHELHSSWNEFIEFNHINNVYLTWEWMFHWWNIYKDNSRQLRIIIAEIDDKIVGIFPLLLRKLRHFGVLPFTRLEFLSTGESAHEMTCPTFLSIPVQSELTQAVYTGFISFLLNKLEDKWDELVLTPLRTDTFATQVLLPVLTGIDGYALEEQHKKPNAYTIVGNDWTNLVSCLGSRTKKKVKSGLKKITNAGVTYEFLTDHSEIDTFLLDYAQLSRKRWEGKGVFASSRYTEFQRRICRDFLLNGQLKLSLMKHNGTVIAGNLDYCYGDTVYGYQTAYDIEASKSLGNLSIGMLGMALCLKNAIETGFNTYDWYRYDGEGDYKSHFGLTTRSIITLRLAKKSAKGAAYTLMVYLKAKAKAARGHVFALRKSADSIISSITSKKTGKKAKK